MDKKGFYYQVSMSVSLAKTEVTRIQRIALSHYDATCIAAAKVGGFIYGWMNSLNLETADAKDFTINLDQVSLVTKILEQESYQKDDITQYWEWRETLIAMVNEFERINNVSR